MYFNSLCFYIKRNNGAALRLRLPSQGSTSLYRCILSRGASHNPFKSMFYWEHLCMASIYHVYVCHIHSAGLFLFSCTLPGLPGLISAAAPGRFRLGLPAYPFCLGHRMFAFSRLRPAKVPQTGVDLINMAVPACPLACTVGTRTQRVKGLLLSLFYDVPFILWNNPLIALWQTTHNFVTKY